MEQSLYVALQDTMLNLADSKGFNAFNRKMFVEGADSDVAVIRRAALYNELFFSSSGTTPPLATIEE